MADEVLLHENFEIQVEETDFPLIATMFFDALHGEKATLKEDSAEEVYVGVTLTTKDVPEDIAFTAEAFSWELEYLEALIPIYVRKLGYILVEILAQPSIVGAEEKGRMTVYIQKFAKVTRKRDE